MPPVRLGPLDQAAMDAAGDLRGLRVLDLGCGSGDLTLALARSGAQTTAVDLSSGMIEVARRRLERFAPDAKVDFVVAAAEELPIEDGSMDVIIGRFILHHLDIPRAAAECSRVLAPGGRALFAENSGRNSVLMFARDHLAGASASPATEHLTSARSHPKTSRRYVPIFRELRLEYPVFDFFTLFDRQILRHRWPGPPGSCVGSTA